MDHKNTPTLPSPLESVQYQFETWREARKNPRERIPEKLWAAATRLQNQYSLSHISKALRLNQTDLKKRIPEKESTHGKKKLTSPFFVELNWPDHFPVSGCIIEMENTHGSKMRMSFKGRAELDLLELGKAFWTQGK
jgi:hypothetical protein